MTRKRPVEAEQLFLFVTTVPRQKRKSLFPVRVKFMQRRNICFVFSKNDGCHAPRSRIERKRRHEPRRIDHPQSDTSVNLNYPTQER